MSDQTRALVPTGDTPEMLLVTQTCQTAHTARKRRLALRDFLAWHAATYGTGVSVLSTERLNRAIVNAYMAYLRDEVGLTPSNINARLTAIRALAREAAANNLLDERSALGIASIKGVTTHGSRTGNWLTKEQAEALLAAPDTSSLIGLRDRALLAVLLGTALRRAEVSALTFAHIQQREGRWVVVDLVGKHRRMRSVPMPSWTKAAIDAWASAAHLSEGCIFRALRRGTHRLSGTSLSENAIYDIVRAYTYYLGIGGAAGSAAGSIAPHDLRRTWAKLAHKGGAAIEQIQLSLGHASIQTTERYLGVDQDLTDAPCDHLGLRIS